MQALASAGVATEPYGLAMLAAALVVLGASVVPAAGTETASLESSVPSREAQWVDPAERDCLAEAVYFEARSEPRAGQVAVAHVVLNRAASDGHPDRVCEVIREGENRGRGRCQFSWRCDGLADIPRDKAALAKAHGTRFVFVPQVLWPSAKNPTPNRDAVAQWLPYVSKESLLQQMAVLNDVMRDVAGKEGIPFVQEVLDHEWKETDFRDYCHFSPDGCSKFSRILARFIQTRGLIPDGGPTRD